MSQTFLIAECGSCHDNDIGKAFDLIRTAKECGADAAKFQFWSSAKRMATRRHAPEYEAAYARYAVPEAWLKELRDFSASMGIDFMCSSYLPEDVDLVAGYVRTMKVASFEANDPVHLAAHVRHVRAGRRVIVSCGLAADVDVIREYLVRRACDENTAGQVDLLWCVSAYPAPLDQLHLRRLRGDHLWTDVRYQGFSDHSPADETLTGAFSVMAGARIVERHLRLDDTDPANPDYPHAMAPSGFAAYVAAIRKAEVVLGWQDHSPQAAGDVLPCEQPLRGYRVREEAP